MACARQTRPGKGLSPYLDANPISCPPFFDLGTLLRESVAAESDDPFDDLFGGPLSEPPSEDDPFDGPLSELSEPPSEDERDQPPTEENSGPPPQKRPLSPPTPGVSRAHKRRRRKRNKASMEEGQFASQRTVASHVAPSVPVPTELVVEGLPAAKGGYNARRGKKVRGAQKAWTALELVEKQGFEYIAWDGYEPRPLLDRAERVHTVLAGRPRDDSFVASALRLHNTMLEEGSASRFEPAERRHCRGNFPALNTGITYGKGLPVPTNLDDKKHAPMIRRLLSNPDTIRLATFASAAFATWAPGVYGYYKERMDKLWARLPCLKRIFPKSVYPCAAFNFGPATRTYKHRDALNCPFGMCAVQALGDFDPKLGGHIVLWEIKKVVEFPPGSLVLIPSATITHSNTPIQPGETRTSFTQYCPGALFRYVDNGFRTEAALEEEDLAAYEKMHKEKEGRWEMGLGLLSRLGDLVKPVAKAADAGQPH